MFIKATRKRYVKSVGKRLQNPTLSGATLREILEKMYPDIRFHIEHDYPGRTRMILSKTCQNGAVGSVEVTFTDEEVSSATIDIMREMIEQGVDKLRTYCGERALDRNNPSSRSFS